MTSASLTAAGSASPCAVATEVRREAESRAALKADGFNVEYFSVRSAETLHAPSLSTEQMVILVAARIGKARLIDNVQVELA